MFDPRYTSQPIKDHSQLKVFPDWLWCDHTKLKHVTAGSISVLSHHQVDVVFKRKRWCLQTTQSSPTLMRAGRKKPTLESCKEMCDAVCKIGHNEKNYLWKNEHSESWAIERNPFGDTYCELEFSRWIFNRREQQVDQQTNKNGLSILIDKNQCLMHCSGGRHTCT